MRQNNGYCLNCNSDFVFKPEDTWFDEHGYGYSTKLTKCPDCGKIVVVKYLEDYNLSRLNTDSRVF